jgi:hypothetical protein
LFQQQALQQMMSLHPDAQPQFAPPNIQPVVPLLAPEFASAVRVRAPDATPRHTATPSISKRGRRMGLTLRTMTFLLVLQLNDRRTNCHASFNIREREREIKRHSRD